LKLEVKIAKKGQKKVKKCTYAHLTVIPGSGLSRSRYRKHFPRLFAWAHFESTELVFLLDAGHLLKNWIEAITAQIIGPEVDIVADEEIATSNTLSRSERTIYELLHAGPVVFEIQLLLGNVVGNGTLGRIFHFLSEPVDPADPFIARHTFRFTALCPEYSVHIIVRLSCPEICGDDRSTVSRAQRELIMAAGWSVLTCGRPEGLSEQYIPDTCLQIWRCRTPSLTCGWADLRAGELLSLVHAYLSGNYVSYAQCSAFHSVV
jgi:hypothetical protein